MEPRKGSHRTPDASLPAAASPPAADEAKKAGMADERAEGVAAERHRVVGPSVAASKMDVDGGGAMVEDQSAAPAAREKVNKRFITPGEVQRLAPAAPDANMEVEGEGGCRKRMLDLLVSSGTATEVDGPSRTKQRVDGCQMSDISVDADTSRNSSDSAKQTPSVPVQAVELPLSSRDIAVPEESLSSLFSVYNFLRSFSVELFLSPFRLDDFAAAINCTVPNNLMDAVHVTLLRVLRQHLETKSAEGSQLSSDCLKFLDWTLLDALTWPSFLLEYLYVMGCCKDLGGRSFCRDLLATEYYKLPVAMKLRVLQILCDHVIDSEQVKTELAAPYKRIDELQNLETPPNFANPEAVVANASQDANIDVCRICGMVGILVCCDGCPWVYHSRCIGLNKNLLPQGKWFCPECVVSKHGPTSSRIERGARGAQMFGIDMHGRLFLGLCNYLLVIGTSSNVESCVRYYSHHDVVKVLRIITLSNAYTDIYRRIVEYWKNLHDIFQRESSKICKEVGASHTLQSNMSLSFTPKKAGDGSVGTASKDGAGSKTVALAQTNARHEFVANQVSVCATKHLEEQQCMAPLGAVTEKNNEICRQTLAAQNKMHNTPINGASGLSVVSSISQCTVAVVPGESNITQEQAAAAQSLLRPVLSTSVSGINGLSREAIMKAESFRRSYQNKHNLQKTAERSGNMSGGKPVFKPQAYMNLYTHGYIAASAADNLADLTSDEGILASLQSINIRRKVAAENALQLKAFSSAAAHFAWPSTDKKLMEVPRDRCGWCLACKSSATGNKKACFLNTATANAAKESARILSAMRLIKNYDSHFPRIVSYLTNMEESLRGLLAGSLQYMEHRQQWHTQLQQASNCRTIVPLLLELESNIRGVAFSPSWSKLIDDWPESTTDYDIWTWWSGGNISKRILQRGALLNSAVRRAARQGGKQTLAGLSYIEGSDLPRGTRQFAWRACVVVCQNSSQLAMQVRYLDAHIRWKEFVPPDQILSDGKGSDVDFSAFRNAVACDKKIVDNKIRYALKFPNQKHLHVRVKNSILEAEDNKGENKKLWFSENHVPLYMIREFEQEAGVRSLPIPGMLASNCFTNLYARRVKAFTGDVFSYLFRKGDVYPCTTCKKDVPFRDIVKCSSCQGNCHKECTSSSGGGKEGNNNTSSLICKLCLQKRSLMLSSYKTNANYIQSQPKINSQQPVPASQITFKVGSSHSAQHAMKIGGQQVSKVGARPIGKVKSQPNVNMKFQPIVNMTFQPVVKAKYQPTIIDNCEWESYAYKVEAAPVRNVATPNTSSVQTQLNTISQNSKTEKPKKHRKPRKPRNFQSITYFGLVWKKHKNDSDGSDFRANDVILKGKDGIGSWIRPICCLCDKTYSPDFLYVRCEKCKSWFHGDALQLEEEKIGELVTYQCCRCRSRAMPQCPHSDDYQSTQPTVLSSEKICVLAEQDPLPPLHGIVEPDADLSTKMASFNPSKQKLSIRKATN